MELENRIVMPKISIIIPVYNVEEYLPKCLDSVINQTLKDIEIICIDDRSTDNSLEILKEFAKKDSRIRIIEQQENQGQGIARNIGINTAQGEYIGFIDPDDYIDITMYEQMYNQAKELNSEIVICDVQKFHENEKRVTKCQCFENVISPLSIIKVSMPAGQNIDKIQIYKTLIASPGYCGNKIYKTELIKHYNIKFSERRCYEDCIFALRSHILAEKISYINKAFYTYRIRKTSTLRSIDSRYKDSKKAYSELNNYLNNIGMKNIFSKNLKYFRNIHAILTYKNTTDKLIKKEILRDAKKRLIKSEYRIFQKKCGISPKINGIYRVIKEKNHIIFKLFKDKIRIKLKGKTFNEPVDIVYCWVDGNDTTWQKEKVKWQKALGLETSNVVNLCRFLDNEELRYSLRSVAMNAPWINHIYIITNGQVPKWLDTSHPKISIVNHKDIMPKDALPTFNSEAIETCLADIPNLSEHFLYANDDFYIYQPITKDFFFDKKGNTIVRFIKQNWTQEQIAKQLYLASIVYATNLMKQKFNKTYKFENAHNIDAYNKSYFLQCKKEFKEEFEKTVRRKFRAPESVQRILVSFYMVHKCNCKYRLTRMFSRKTKLENIYIKLSSAEQMDRLINKNMPKLKLFCINDNENTLQENRERLGAYLKQLFPKKQEWELD